MYRPIHMALGCQMHYRPYIEPVQRIRDRALVASASLDAVAGWVIRDSCQIAEVTRVGQFVETNDSLVRHPNHPGTKFAPMKPAPPVSKTVNACIRS